MMIAVNVRALLSLSMCCLSLAGGCGERASVPAASNQERAPAAPTLAPSTAPAAAPVAAPAAAPVVAPVAAPAPAAPEVAARVANPALGPDCVLEPSAGLPDALGPYRLGQRLDKRARENDAASRDVTAWCLYGDVTQVVRDGRVVAISLLDECFSDHPDMCDEVGPLATKLERALGVKRKRIPGQEEGYAAFLFEQPGRQLRLQRFDEPGGVQGVRLELIALDAEGLCSSKDGFAEFHKAFLEAVARDDRNAVADAFRYPFEDGAYAVTKDEDQGAKSKAELLAKYDRLFQPKRPGKSQRDRTYPSKHPTCDPSLEGYVDENWLAGSVIAKKVNGRWKWVASAFRS